MKEETAEVEAEMISGDRTAMEEEFGDLLFALVNACRLYGIDPESALERSNKKFMNRFNYMEECASSEGHTLHELSLDRMEELWQQAKHAAAEKSKNQLIHIELWHISERYGDIPRRWVKIRFWRKPPCLSAT